VAFLVAFIQVAIQIITLLVIVQVVLSFIMSPFHPLRQTIDRIVEPFLAPIRRVVPPIGGLDFSPLILLVIVQILGTILLRLISSL
jgi:YggT family protein